MSVTKDDRQFVMFGGDEHASDLGMYKRAALADDAAVAPPAAGSPGQRDPRR